MKTSWLITWGREGNQAIKYIFVRNFLNFDFVEFILPATRTPLIIALNEVHTVPELKTRVICKICKNLNQSEFQYFI